MKRQVSVLAVCLIVVIMVPYASAAVYASDSSFSVNIKYDNGVATASEQFMRVITGKPMAGEFEIETAPVNPEREMINVISVTKNGETKRHNIQTPKVSNIYVSSRTIQDTDVMQTTTEPGYPVLEIYWRYDQSPDQPWQYYMRVNNVGDTQAVYSDFATKVIWTKPITPARTADIINSGVIPEWGAV